MPSALIPQADLSLKLLIALAAIVLAACARPLAPSEHPLVGRIWDVRAARFVSAEELFDRAEKTKGLNDPAYRKARAISFQAAGPNGIDKLLKDNRVAALVGPTMPPAWMIDAVNG